MPLRPHVFLLLQFTFRIVTRDTKSPKAAQLSSTGVEVFQGDMTDGATLAAAMKGVYGMFLMTDANREEVAQGKSAIDAAFAAGVQYVVYTSVGGLTTKLGREVPHFATKYQVEQHLKSKPWKDGYAILRPTAFFENLEMFGPLTFGSLKFLTPPSVKLQQISTKDIGEFAALAFTKPENYRGKELEIAGDDISGVEMARILAELTGSKWSYSKMMPTWALRLISYDVYKMEVFFEQEGYKADIPALRALKPDLRDFRTWAKSKGIGKPNVYTFAPPTPMGSYLAAGALAVAAVVAGWWFREDIVKGVNGMLGRE